MPSVNVDNGNIAVPTGAAQGWPHSTRDSNGIEYAAFIDSTSGDLRIYKGNSASSPSSFAEQDASNNPSNADYCAVCCCIDSSDVLHIMWVDYSEPGNSVDVYYETYTISTDTFSGSPTVVHNNILNNAISIGSVHACMCLDANEDIHFFWLSESDNMGTTYQTLYYTNNISGWSTPLEVDGLSSTTDVITVGNCLVDDDSKPVVAYAMDGGGGTFDYFVALGNALNATSFSIHNVNTPGTLSCTPSVGIDANGDHYYIHSDGNSGNVTHLFYHDNADGWTTWSTENTFGISGFYIALFERGGYLHAFEENRNNGAIYHYRYPIGSGNSWAVQNGGSPVLGTASTNEYTAVKSGPSFSFIKYGANGTDYGRAQTSTETDRLDFTANGTSGADAQDVVWATVEFTLAGPTIGTVAGVTLANIGTVSTKSKANIGTVADVNKA